MYSAHARHARANRVASAFASRTLQDLNDQGTCGRSIISKALPVRSFIIVHASCSPQSHRCWQTAGPEVRSTPVGTLRRQFKCCALCCCSLTSTMYNHFELCRI